MNRRILKILKIAAIAIVSIVFLVALSIGIMFQFVLTPEKITPKVVQAINKNLNAELSIDAVELTFFKTFPNFKLELKNGLILNAPKSIQDSTFIPNDTLIQFDYGVVSVNPVAFIGNSIEVNKFSFENPTIYAYVSPEGDVNWDILKENESKIKGIATLDFDFKLSAIDLSKLTYLMPILDSVLPMADSFEGKVNFRMQGNTKIDQNLGMSASSLDAIARVQGDNLVVLSGKTFEKMAKMLLFKNKERNTIDKLEFAMVFKNQQIEIFPSVVTVDRYLVAIGGHHNLDLTYDYHVSILKSPMPFKAGIDLKGTEEDMDFKVTKAKYKYLFSTKERQRKKADSTLIKRKNSIIRNLTF